MKVINYFEIVVTKYYDETAFSIRFADGDMLHESQLYSAEETNNIIALMRDGVLRGSFAVGCRLAPDARFQIVEEFKK